MTDCSDLIREAKSIEADAQLLNRRAKFNAICVSAMILTALVACLLVS